jgi:hypothetical protein
MNNNTTAMPVQWHKDTNTRHNVTAQCCASVMAQMTTPASCQCNSTHNDNEDNTNTTNNNKIVSDNIADAVQTQQCKQQQWQR